MPKLKDGSCVHESSGGGCGRIAHEALNLAPKDAATREDGEKCANCSGMGFAGDCGDCGGTGLKP